MVEFEGDYVVRGISADLSRSLRSAFPLLVAPKHCNNWLTLLWIKIKKKKKRIHMLNDTVSVRPGGFRNSKGYGSL
jgi:hypothetical protein